MGTNNNNSSNNASIVNTPERQMTPSTTVSEYSVDENQWIKRPPL